MSESPFPSLSEPAPRQPRRSGRGLVLRWLLRGGIAALLIVLIGQILRSGSTKPADRPVPPTAERPVTLPPTVEQRKQSPPAWEKSVVAIESSGDVEPSSRGSGFLVGDTGLVATNLHVSATCTDAVARLADGTTYQVAGYAAVDPAHDLALLKLVDAPESLVGLTLGSDGDLPRRHPVWAIGHPQGIDFSQSPGEVSRMLQTGDLPAASQRFLRDLTPGGTGSRWIQHSASIAPGSSGGPLVDAQGRVLGINTWVDQEARFNYALHVGHLRALMQRATPDKPQPLLDHATAEARMNQQLWQLSAMKLQSLLEQGRGMKWQPQSPDDYRVLQQLAWAITISRQPDALAARGTLGDRLEELAKGADAVSAQLRQEKWNQVGQVTILNEYAAEELRRPMAGLFFFATVQRVVAGDDQRRGLIATLAGFEEPLFLPLEDQLIAPEAGAQVLVLGVNYHGRIAQWGDNPLKLTSAPIVMPGALIELD